MKFKLDENMPADAAALFRAAGHDAHTVAEENLEGTDDPDLAQLIRSEQRTLITLDLHFADIRAYPPQNHCGIIVIRLKHQDKRALLAAVRRLLPFVNTDALHGKLWVIRRGRVYIRHGASQ